MQQGVPVEKIAEILQAQSTQPVGATVPAQVFPDSNPRERRPTSRSRSPPQRRRSPYSRSPPPRRPIRRRDDSPPPRPRRGSPVYEDYGARSRSPPPPARRRSPPPRERSPIRKAPPPMEIKPRYIEWDESLKPDRIRGTLPWCK
jgi:hypothetical protein